MHAIVQSVFSVLIVLQFLAVTLHDWLDIPGWTHGSRIRAVFGTRRFALATLVNAIFPGIAVAFIFLYRSETKPSFVTSYWVIHRAVTVVSAIMMWWVPYFFGADEKTRRQHQSMYEGTVHVLPPRGDNPRPNLLHLCFHALFLATLSLAIALRLP
jgi:hypothetical protein